MAEEKQEFPGHFWGPNGATQIFESADEVPKGWVDHPNKLKSAKAETPAAEPDKEPATDKQPSPLGEARKAYKEKFDKNPSPKMTLEAINEALAKAEETHDL